MILTFSLQLLDAALDNAEDEDDFFENGGEDEDEEPAPRKKKPKKSTKKAQAPADELPENFCRVDPLLPRSQLKKGFPKFLRAQETLCTVNQGELMGRGVEVQSCAQSLEQAKCCTCPPAGFTRSRRRAGKVGGRRG